MGEAFDRTNQSVKQLLLNIQQMFDNQTYQDAVIHLQPLSSINDVLNFRLTEQPIYGSACLGVRNLERTEVYARYLIDKKQVTAEPEDPTQPLLLTPPNPEGNVANLLQDQPEYSLTLGNKQYELSNHLGNVQVTLSDKKLGQAPPESSSFTHYLADVRSAVDYYPFGMQMPGRSLSGGYRYGFNGKEKDNEVKGDGNSLDFGARIYDARLGRWLSLDPLQAKYPSFTPYSFVNNSPTFCIDPDGRKIVIYYLDENNRKQSITISKVADIEKLKNKDGFLGQMYETLNYLKGSHVLINAIETKKKVYVEQSDRTEYEHLQGKGRTIQYDPLQGLELVNDDQVSLPKEKRRGNGKIQSPAIGFLHELGHFINEIENVSEMIERTTIKDDLMHDCEEDNVIINYENPFAEQKGEPSRTNHSGITRTVESPTSRKVDSSKKEKKKTNPRQL